MQPFSQDKNLLNAKAGKIGISLDSNHRNPEGLLNVLVLTEKNAPLCIQIRSYHVNESNEILFAVGFNF